MRLLSMKVKVMVGGTRGMASKNPPDESTFDT